MGFLTHDELLAVQSLHKRAPYVIASASQGIFSIAGHFGGMRYQGCEYVYHPPTDECIRWDVFKMAAKMRKAAHKARNAEMASKQMDIS